MLRLLLNILKVGLTIAYPFAVFFMLERNISFRILGLIFLAFICVNFISSRKWIMLAAGAVLALLIAVFEQEIFLKLYPVIMNSIVAFTFVFSLRGQPLIEKFAIKMGYAPSEELKQYSRKSTIAWSIFLSCNLVCSIVTVFLSTKVWIFYNGLLSYIFIGIAMLIEFIVHRRLGKEK